MENLMRDKLRMTYLVPTASGYLKEHVIETQDGREWEEAVNTAHRCSYQILKVERVKK